MYATGMTSYGYDPRFGPVGYQPVEFLDIAPMTDTFAAGVGAGPDPQRRPASDGATSAAGGDVKAQLSSES